MLRDYQNIWYREYVCDTLGTEWILVIHYQNNQFSFTLSKVHSIYKINAENVKSENTDAYIVYDFIQIMEQP